MELTVPDPAQDNLDLAAFEDGDDAPVPDRFARSLPLLAGLHLEFLHGLLELLESVGVFDEADGTGEELEAHHL